MRRTVWASTSRWTSASFRSERTDVNRKKITHDERKCAERTVKAMKKIVSCFLAALIFGLLLTGIGTASMLALDCINFDDSVDAYANLCTALNQGETCNDYFDENFAGGAIEKDGKLTLFISVENETELEACFNRYCIQVPELKELAVPVLVTYSLNELLTFQLKTVPDIDGYGILSCGIDYRENRLIIGCLDSSDLFRFGKLSIPADAYRLFAEETGIQYTALHGGDEICPAVTTLGWCGTYNNSPAIVTCAHGNYGANSLTINCGNDTSYTATRVFDSINNLSDTARLGDFYIATVGSGITTNYIHGMTAGTLIACGSYLPSVPQGSTVYACGKVTKRIVGTTQQTYTYYVDRSETINSSVIYGLVKVNTAASNYQLPVAGDSGGPVYYAYTDGGIGATGTITGYSGDGYLLFSPLKYAVNNGFSLRTW